MQTKIILVQFIEFFEFDIAISPAPKLRQTMFHP
jgi:hypothetical protein